jgi:hypothetical protein
MVTDSNIAYEKATLPAQLRRALALQGSYPPPPPSPSSLPQAGPSAAPTSVEVTSTGGGDPGGDGPVNTAPNGGDITPAKVAPSAALIGCVFHLTGDVAPMFVDQATYQSEEVYVIAVTDKAWVVSLGCTASRPTLITSVQLGAVR